MKVSVSKDSIDRHKTTLLVMPVFEGESPFKKTVNGKYKMFSLSVDGHGKADNVLFVGLGKKKDLTAERVRIVAGLAVQRVQALEFKQFAAFATDQMMASSLVEGFILGSYQFDKYKSEKKPAPACTILSSKTVKVADAHLICENVNMVRDMVNENADVMTTIKIASIAKDIARNNRLKIKIFEETELKKMGMGLILGVAQGSRYPPRLIIIEYRGAPGKKETTAIVGKGITFDTGGMNLKPTGYIETMKQDMAGAATVLGIIKTVAELKLKVNVTAVVPTAENMIGKDAIKPGDVLKSYSGKSVEIGNTDAEGRLILGDAVAYTEKHLKPTRTITIATLTGTSFVIFGEYVTSMIGTDTKAMKKLFAAGQATYERVWELPLYEEYKEELKADSGDITNLGYNNGRYAGTIMGAAFIHAFSEKTPLVHFDIGNTAYREKPKSGYLTRNATGTGMRLLVEYFRSR